MKHLKIITLCFLTLAAFTFTNCSKSDDGGDGGNAPNGRLVAKVDGKTFESLEISSTATIANDGQNLVIIATNTEAIGFAISVFGFEGVGTYEFDGGSLGVTNTAIYTETNVNLSNPANSTTEMWAAPYEASVAGTIKVAEITDTKVIGTFSFKAKNSNDNSIKTIAEGSFNLKKVTQ